MLINVVYFLKFGLIAQKKINSAITTSRTMNFCPPILSINDLLEPAFFVVLFAITFSLPTQSHV